MGLVEQVRSILTELDKIVSFKFLAKKKQVFTRLTLIRLGF